MPGTVAAKNKPTARRTSAPTDRGASAAWTFLSNHAHVLLMLARDPEIRLRDVAEHRIVADLESARYIERERQGRRNRYRVHPEMPLRHPVEAHRRIGSLIAMVIDG